MLNNVKTGWIILAVAIFVIGLMGLYYVYLYTPKDSIELYQSISNLNNIDEAEQIMLEGYEVNLNINDLDFLTEPGNAPTEIQQYSFFVYQDKTYIAMTTPGTNRLKVLKIDKLPEDIRKFFIEFSK